MHDSGGYTTKSFSPTMNACEARTKSELVNITSLPAQSVFSPHRSRSSQSAVALAFRGSALLNLPLRIWSMEQQVLDLLVATLDPSDPIRNDAERHLESLYTNDAFPISLISIASHKSVPLEHRQAALLCLKKLVLKIWSPSLEEYQGPTTLSDPVKEQVRQSVLEIATASGEERKILAASAYVVSKIASADFPEQWPTLLPTLLNLVPQAEPTQLYGVLVVLSNLVEDGFDEEQFSTSAVQLVKCLYDVAVDGQKKLMTRALAVSIFRACFDTMELVYQTNPDAVQQFMQQASDVWTPYFLGVVRMPLPQTPGEQETNEIRSEWQGAIALKTQVVKVGHKRR